MSSKTMTLREFAKKLEGNERVIIKQNLIFAWSGGHTVNVYSALTGTPIECFNVGDFKYESATLEQVEEGINEYLKEVN